jgi:hypothetical protein
VHRAIGIQPIGRGLFACAAVDFDKRTVAGALLNRFDLMHDAVIAAAELVVTN